MEASVNVVFQFLSFVAGAVYFSIDASCFIGYLIVRNCVTFFSILFEVSSYLLRLLQVIIEDYCIFISDFFNALYNLGYLVQLFVESVNSFYLYVTYLARLFYCCLSTIGNFVIGSVISVFNVLLYIVQSVVDIYILGRNSAFLVGLCVWNIAVSIPEHTYSLVYHCLQKCIGGVSFVNKYVLQQLSIIVYEPHIIFLFIYKCVKSFMLELPFKPLGGLSIAVFIICLVLKKRHSLLNFAYCTWLSVTTRSQQVVVSAWQTFEGYVLWLLTNQRRDWQRIPLNDRFNDGMFDETETDSASEAADSDVTDASLEVTPRKRAAKDQGSDNMSENMDARLCVVCQDRTRSILTLPCRHVCLCSNCCKAVRACQGLCPLCRQEITFAGRVYL